MTKPMGLLVRDAVEYIDNGLATASWWDKYHLAAGLYRFEPVDIQHRPVREGERPYYMKVAVSATLVETYRENRLLSEVRSQTERPMQPRLVTFTPYAYSVKPGTNMFIGGVGEVVEVLACEECGASPERDCLMPDCQGRWI